MTMICIATHVKGRREFVQYTLCKGNFDSGVYPITCVMSLQSIEQLAVSALNSSSCLTLEVLPEHSSASGTKLVEQNGMLEALVWFLKFVVVCQFEFVRDTNCHTEFEKVDEDPGMKFCLTFLGRLTRTAHHDLLLIWELITE